MTRLQELDGLGIYNIRASVPSPMVNVLCANVEESDITDIVYETSPQGKEHPLNFTSWPLAANFSDLNDFKIKTPLDDLFGWGNETGQHPPSMFSLTPTTCHVLTATVFFKLPLPYNTLLNQTFQYGREAIYLLGRGGPLQNNQLFMCSFKATHYANCSTNFTATGSGATLNANCEDPNDPFAYVKSNASAQAKIELDWPWIASDWGNSVSLSDGLNDGNSSNARLLTELALQNAELNPALPSPAEALAVMIGSTLLSGSAYAPFVEFWVSFSSLETFYLADQELQNYTQNILDTPQYQYFNASIRAQQYASGGVFKYQKAFFVILFIVFFTNVLVLAYFIAHKGVVTDYSDPANLFTLAINSPPSELLSGSCGGGPEGEQFRVNWRVMNEGSHLYMASEEPKGWKKRPVSTTSFELVSRTHASTPVSRTYSKFSRRTTLL